MVIPAWVRSNANMRWLLTARALRSFSQGFLSVVVPLYLVTLGFRGLALGSLLTLATVGGSLMSLAVGLTGDRYGRRPAMIGVAAVAVVGMLGFIFARSYGLLVAASVLSTVGAGGGVGGGGAWGPFYPAEQPLVASSCEPEQRNAAFAAISFVGVLAGAAGSALAVVPQSLHSAGWAWAPAYRVMFWVGAAITVGTLLSCLRVRERRPEGVGSIWPSAHAWSVLRRLSLTNALNGFGWGFLGALLTYWFYERFHVGPAALGGLFTAANVLAAIPYLGAAALARRLGAVRAVTSAGVAAAALLVVMGLAPTFTVAAAVFLLRIAVNALSLPIRQSYVMGITEDRHRSAVAAIGGLPSQLTASLSPSIGTYLMQTWTIEAPLWLAAAFQFLNWAVYWSVFRRERPPEERRPAAEAAPAGAERAEAGGGRAG
jgi:MFS family permease